MRYGITQGKKLATSAEQGKIRVRPNAVYPRTKQYKLSKEVEEGIKTCHRSDVKARDSERSA